jgi:hypothetical protein
LFQSPGRDAIAKQSTATQLALVWGLPRDDAGEMLAAKIAGRWSDSVPLALAPTVTEWKQFNERYPLVDPQKDPHRYAAPEQALIDFRYKDDPQGLKCPLTSHMRRVNTRDMLAPRDTDGSVLNNRRRILRSGLPYSDSSPGVSDADEHGIVMLIVCASLCRQFEFVQQQWLNYGLDSNAGKYLPAHRQPCGGRRRAEGQVRHRSENGPAALHRREHSTVRGDPRR